MSLLHQSRRPTWTIAACAISATFLATATAAFAQDAQTQATAKAAHDRAAADATAQTSPVSKDRDASKTDDKAVTPNPEALKRRAGERVGDDPRGRSLVMGMHLQESGRGGVKVVEVSAGSPAFEARIREGDELVEFAGLHANTYRKWIDGIGKLAKEAEDNSMLPVTLMRNGERVETQIRVAESHVGPVKLPLGPLPQQQAPPQSDGAAGAVAIGAPGAGGGNNIAIENIGPFGEFFSGESSPTNERAMAQIFRVGAAQATGKNTGAVAPVSGAAPTPDKGARIGLAGFRNDPNGIMVMVDVGGLKPGNYLVGLSDPALIGGGNGGDVPPRVQPPVGTPARPQLPPPADGVRPQAPGSPGGIPRSPITDPAAPQSSLKESHGLIPKGILAQVSDTAAPPTGQVQPLTAPPTGQVNPTNTTPTGQSTVNNALEEQARRANQARVNGGVNSKPIGNQIGTLTVDQSGTGRMQKVVEGLQVRDIVGQAIVLYAGGEATKTLPPNLNPTADPAQGKSANGAPSPPGPKPANSDATAAAGLNPTTSQGAVGQAGTPNTKAPVAAGIIRLVSDRRPPTPGQPAAAASPNAAVEQPASNTPPVGTNPIR